MQKARGQAFHRFHPACAGAPPWHSPPTACRHTVSGTISLPSQGFFSPFPHGTGSLSVTSEYLALRDGPRGFPQGFSCPTVLRNPLRVRSISLTRLSRSMAGLSRSVQLSSRLV